MSFRTSNIIFKQPEFTGIRRMRDAMRSLVKGMQGFGTGNGAKKGWDTRGKIHDTFVTLGYDRFPLSTGFNAVYERGAPHSKDGLYHHFHIHADGSWKHKVINPYGCKRGYATVQKGQGEEKLVIYLRKDLGPGNGQPPPLSYVKKHEKGLGYLDYPQYLRQLMDPQPRDKSDREGLAFREGKS
jgi:hypothetical protein